MKVKALKHFHVQSLRGVVTPGTEFDTSDSHGKELIAKGLAEFVAESTVVESPDLTDYEQKLVNKHTEDLQEQVSIKSGEIIALTNDIESKAAEIATLNASTTEKDEKISELEADIESKTAEIVSLTAKIEEIQKENSAVEDKKTADKGKKA